MVVKREKGPAERASAATISDPITDDKRFEELRVLGLDRALEIMRLRIEPDHKQFARLIGIQAQIIQTVMTATVRVDQGSLRPKSDDRYARMLADAQAQAKRLGREIAQEAPEALPD